MVTVLSVNGRQVKLGIEAPKHIAVHREEIKIRIDANNNKNTLVSLNKEKV